MRTKNHNHEVRFLSYRVRQTDLFVIWDYFLPLRGLPLTTWKIKVLEKGKCHHFTFVYQKPWSYDVCFLRYGVCERHNFLSFWVIFWPFTRLITPKIKSFEKMKNKTTGAIIILLMCTINDNHIMYGFWDMKRNRHNFFVIWDYFWPFHSLRT